MRSQGLPMRLNQARNIISHHLPSNLTRAAVADAATRSGPCARAYPDDFALLPAVNGTCADLADYSEPYELTDRPRVCRGGKLGEDAGPVFVALWRVRDDADAVDASSGNGREPRAPRVPRIVATATPSTRR